VILRLLQIHHATTANLTLSCGVNCRRNLELIGADGATVLSTSAPGTADEVIRIHNLLRRELLRRISSLLHSTAYVLNGSLEVSVTLTCCPPQLGGSNPLASLTTTNDTLTYSGQCQHSANYQSSLRYSQQHLTAPATFDAGLPIDRYYNYHG
jgi:hypothetical protein